MYRSHPPARCPADERHRFGYGRAQYVGAIVAATLFVSFTSFELFREAIPRLFAHHEAEHSNVTVAIVVLGVSMLVGLAPLFSLLRQKKALEVQKSVTDTTNELLAKNSEMLKDSSLAVARESERGIVEVETLKKVNDDLIATIEETLRIQAEGSAKRAQAEAELSKIEADLKARLSSAKA